MVRDLNDQTLVSAVAIQGVSPALYMGSVDGPTFVRLCEIFGVPAARRRIFEYDDQPPIAVYETCAGGIDVRWQGPEREVADELAARERAEATP